MVAAMSDTVHHVPGRLRLRIAKLRRDPAAAARAGAALGATPGVRAVSVNARTGSLLVHYDVAAVTAAGLAEVLRNTGISVPSRPAQPPRLAAAAASWAFERLLERGAVAVICALI